MVVCQLSRDVISYFIDYDFYQQTLSQFLLSFSLQCNAGINDCDADSWYVNFK